MRRLKSVAFRCEETLHLEVTEIAKSLNLSVARLLLLLIEGGLAVFKRGGLPALKQTREVIHEER